MSGEALEVGMIDDISTLENLVLLLQQGNPISQRSGNMAGANEDKNKGIVDVKTHDEIVSEAKEKLKAEGYIEKSAITMEMVQGNSTLFNEIKSSGAADESKRIQGVLGKKMAGHGELIQKMMFDGKTTPDQAASKILEAEQGKLSKINTDLDADAKEVPDVNPVSGGDGVAPEDKGDKKVNDDNVGAMVKGALSGGRSEKNDEESVSS